MEQIVELFGRKLKIVDDDGTEKACDNCVFCIKCGCALCFDCDRPCCDANDNVSRHFELIEE